MKQNLVAEILELPVAERVRLVEAIWDSISAIPESLPLTQWQREELDRRFAEYEADPGSGATLEEVFDRIRRSFFERGRNAILEPRSNGTKHSNPAWVRIF